MFTNAQGGGALDQKEKQIQSPKVQNWFNCEYFYS